MPSYLPHPGQPVSVWQSEMQKPGPVKRAGFGAVRSGSGRDFGSAYKGPVITGRVGQILQQTTAQTGNYLLYRDQYKWQKEHADAQKLKEEGEAINHANAVAVGAMLGAGPPGSPRQKRSLGPPNTKGHVQTKVNSSPTVAPSGGVAPAKPYAGPASNGGMTSPLSAPPTWGGARDPFGRVIGGGLAGGQAAHGPMHGPAEPTPTPGFNPRRPGLAGPVLTPDSAGPGRQPFQPELPFGSTDTPRVGQGTPLSRRRPTARYGTGMNLNNRPTF